MSDRITLLDFAQGLVHRRAYAHFKGAFADWDTTIPFVYPLPAEGDEGRLKYMAMAASSFAQNCERSGKNVIDLSHDGFIILVGAPVEKYEIQKNKTG
jgi:hypothetical protein